MARQRMEDPVVKALDDYDAQRTADLVAKNVARTEKIKQIIAEECAEIGRSDLTDEAKAKLIQKKVTARARLKKDLKTGTITKYMRELRVQK